MYRAIRPHDAVLGSSRTSTVDMLLELRKALADDGVLFTVARAKGMLRDVFDSTGVTAAVGSENFFPTVAAGVAAFTQREPPVFS